MNEKKSIQLLYTAGKPLVWFREITGRDELLLKSTKTADAIDLVNRLIVKQSDHEQLFAEQIATADRDRILSGLCQDIFGSKVEASLHCVSCSKLYELDFLLNDLETHLQSGIKIIRNDQGVYYLDNDCCFRLPTGEDELAIAELPAEKATPELLSRCLLKGDTLILGDEVQETMSMIAPVLQTEMLTYCPECGAEQKIRFDVQLWFLTKLIQQKARITKEIHQLAFAYKWGHNEILDLPRHLRQAYAACIESETEIR